MAINKEKKNKLKDIMKDIRKNIKTEINFVSEIEESLRIKYYKTPSYEINAMLGGGFAKGKIIELYGQNSCGKTSLAIETIAKNQKDDPDFVAGWFETEGSVEPNYLKELGVDIDRLIYWDQKETGAEQGFEILRGLVASGEFNFIVVNSIGGLVPNKEIEDNIEKANIALTARMLSKLFRIITGAADKNGTSLLFINQLRSNCDSNSSKYNPNVTTGGKALGFFASQRLSMAKRKLQAGDPITEEEGIKIECKSIKNRYSTGNPFKSCSYLAVFGKGIDSVSELPELLVKAGVLVSKGSWYYYKENDGETNKIIDGIECKWRSKKALVQDLKTSSKLLSEFELLFDKSLRNTNINLSNDLSAEEINEIKATEVTEENIETETEEINLEEEKDIEDEMNEMDFDF